MYSMEEGTGNCESEVQSHAASLSNSAKRKKCYQKTEHLKAELHHKI